MPIKLEDLIPGGKADAAPKKGVNKYELEKGIKVEMEHTDSKAKAEEIARDHLAEDPNYYSKLDKAGLVDESKVGDLYIQIGETIEEMQSNFTKLVNMFRGMEDTTLIPILNELKKAIIKLKNKFGDSYQFESITEQVGRRRQIDEALPRVDGVHLRKGMKVRLKAEDEILENHYYENHPQKYKKLAKQIAGTTQQIEEIGTSKSSFDVNNVKLVGFDLWIEDKDIEYIVDSAGKTIIQKQHMDKLKFAIEDAVHNYLLNRTTIDSRNLSKKEIGNIVRDVANMIAKEGKIK